jgi:hypothetical protein
MRLHEQVKCITAENETLKENLHLLKVYLMSSKFAEDTTVQTKDVLNRIDEIVKLAMEAKENNVD